MRINVNDMNKYYGNKAVTLLKGVRDEVIERPTNKKQYHEFMTTLSDMIRSVNSTKGVEKMKTLCTYENNIRHMAVAIQSQPLINVARKLSEYNKFTYDDFIDDYAYENFLM